MTLLRKRGPLAVLTAAVAAGAAAAATAVAGTAGPAGAVGPLPPPGAAPPTGACGVADDPYGGPGDLFALSADNRLLRLDGGNFLVERSVPVAVPAGIQLLGLDTRPANGTLYAFGTDSRLYVLDPGSGQATRVGPAGTARPVDPTDFGLDFNPVADRVRLVGTGGLNGRLDPTTGGLAGLDTPLAYEAGDPAAGTAPQVTAIAYTNSVAGATSTLVYGIDTGTDTLVRLGSASVSPNTGRLTTVGSLGLDAARVTGFDVVGDRALATLLPAGETRSVLVRVDLATGRVTRLLRLQVEVRGLTGSPGAPTTAYASTGDNTLVAFDRASPTKASAPVAITGLRPEETVVGLDVRPATGQLYAIGSTNRLYRLDPATGVATQVGSGRFATGSVGRVGMDFNPVVDRVRVVTGTGLNLRLDPETGVATTDTALAFAPGDPNAGTEPRVTAAAYTDNRAGATSTTLYDLETDLDVLAVQLPPNNGTLNTVGRLGVAANGVNGFDIAADGSAVAAIGAADGPSTLHCVDLATGRLRAAGRIGTGTQVTGLAVAPRGVGRP